MIPFALRRLSFALALVLVPQAASAQFAIQRTSSPIFYNDVGNNPSLQCMYAAYEVTNTGGFAVADVWVEASGFTGGSVTLAPGEDGLVQLGAMAPGQSKTAYFYLQGVTLTAAPQNHTVRVYPSRPPVAPALTQSYTLTSVESTINANANKVTTVVSGPNPPQIGGIITITVTGETGTIGSPPMLAFSPAADLAWSPAVFELISSQITLSGTANAGVVTDSLVIAPTASSANTDYVAVYTLRAAGSTAAPTYVSPIGYFASGTQIKHTDTGNFGGFTPIAPGESKLTLTKSATPTYIIDGGISTYTIDVRNTGFAGATLDDIKDVLPGASTIVPGTSTLDGVPIADPAIFGQNAFWYGPIDMPPNSARQLVYQVSFPATAGIFVNQALAHVGIALIDTTLAVTDSVPAQAPVEIYVHNADISVTKGDVPDPVGPDSVLTWTMVVANAGPDTAFSTSLVDTLPAGVNFVSVNATFGAVSESGGIISAAIGTLAPGESSTITVVVVPTLAGTLVNRAHATNARVDYFPTNNTATATTTVAVPPAADLQLVKRATPSTFTVGELISYTLTMTNVGSGPTQAQVALVDTLPAGMTFVTGSGPGWTVSESGGVVTATSPGPIALGDSSIVTIQAIATVAAFPGVRNFAQSSTYHDESADNDTSSVVSAVVSAPDLALVKSHAGDFYVGSPGQYRVSVTNVGNLPALSTITVVDTLPNGLSYVSASGAGWAINESSGVVTATNPGPLAPGDSLWFTIDVTVAVAAVPGVVNAAVAQTAGDVGALNDRGIDPTTVIGFPDVQMIKRAVGPFIEGGLATWTLTATNVGSGATTAPITIVDTLAPGAVYQGATGAGFAIGFVDPTLTATYASALAPGDSATVTVTVRLGGAALPSIANTSVANTPGDTSAGNDSSSTSTPVGAAPNLRIAKTHAGDFTVGQSGQYVITVWNEGSVDPGSFTVTDTLPGGLSFVSGAGAGWNLVFASGGVVATRAAGLAPGDSASFTIDVNVGPAAAPSVVNEATVVAPGDVDPTNDRASDPTNVIALAPDLQVVKRAPAAPFTVGGTGTYEITITNTGTGPTTGAIAVVDTLPGGLSFVSGSAPGFTVSALGGLVTANGAGPLAAGDSVVVTIDTHVDAAAFPSVVNTARASTVDDPDPSDDASTLVTGITSAPDIRIEKTHATDFTVGQTGQYRITVFNIGSLPTPATMVVRDTLPAGLTYVSGTGASWSFAQASGIVDAMHGDPIAPGDSATFTLDVLVGPAALPSVTNTAVALTIGDVDAANDRAVDPTVVISNAPDIQVVLRPLGAPFTLGGTATYTASVTNVGVGPTTGAISLTNLLPPGLAFLAGNGPGWIVAHLAGSISASSGLVLAPGDSIVVTLSCRVGLLALPAVSDTARVSTPGDLNPSNDMSFALASINGAPDVRIEKTHAVDFTVGLPGQYRIAVFNEGSLPTLGSVTVLDTLPAGLGFTSGSGAGWSVLESGGIVTATHAGAIAAGDSASFTLDVTVGAAALPSAINAAVVSAGGDLDPDNDRALDPTTVGGAPDLTLFKTHQGSFTVGQPGIYRIAVLNVGTAPTTGVITVVDTLQAGLTFSALSGAGWTSSVLGNIVTATYAAPLAPADSAVFTLTVLVGPAAFPSVQNAAVAQTPDDNNPGNDRGGDPPATVGPASQLALEKSAAPRIVEPADVVSYTLVLQNQGGAPVPGVTVQDTLPVGFRYAAGTATVDGVAVADPAGAPGAGLSFAVGSVPANGQLILRYRAFVGTSAVLGDGINRAYAESGTMRSNTAAAQVEVRGGVFADEGVIAGKVWADCDCDSNGVQRRGELGVPGVRVYLEDGRSAVTDVEGKYHFEAVDPRLHTVKLDRATLPVGARPMALDSRDAGGAGSRFADLKQGELVRADFALAGCEPAMIGEVHARRELGEVFAAIPTGQPTAAASVLPGATRILAGPAAEGAPAAQSDDGAYFHLEPRASINAANSNLPDAPGTPGLLAETAPRAPEGLAISVPRRPAPADGRTLVPVTVRVPGASPTRVTLDSNLGLWQVVDQDPKTEGVQTTVTSQATFVLVAPMQAGNSIVRVTEVTAFGDSSTLRPVHQAEADVAFHPAARPWLIAGTIEGRYEARSVHDDELVPGQVRDRFEDAFGTMVDSNDDGTALFGGRGAVFARGALGREAQVTFRYDSERAHDRRRFDDIRPDEGDNLFGDASISGFEAQSTERLYARIDNGRSYALYGDFMTDGLDPIRRLGAYTRGINGARVHGERGNLALDAWGTHDRDRQVVDEQPGRGISGPYPLSRRDGVLNSEKVEIVTRDRNNPSVVLERKTMVRFADYTIEPFTGRLLFRAPVASLDERLNPVSIRVSYEVEGGGDRFWTAGGSAHLKPVDRVELMGNYVKEDDPLEEHEQFGAGTTLRVLDRTYLTGEWAHTDSAGTLASDAYRGEIRHGSDRLDLRAFGLRTDPGFNNASSGYAAGREEWGGEARYALGSKTTIAAEGVRTRDVVTEGVRKGASLAIDRRFTRALSFGVGYRWARESAIPAGGGPAVPTPNETDAARARLAFALGMRASVSAEYEKNFGQSEGERLAVGADVRATDHVRAYARHEFLNGLAGPYAINEQQEQNTTVFGFAADGHEDLSAFSEYRIRDAFAGRNAEAAIGLRDRFRLSRALRLTLAMERVSPKSGDPATSLASGLEWTGNPLTKGTLRLEFRDASNEEQWLASAGLARKLGRDWAGMVRSQWAWSPGQSRTVARDELALSLRETDDNGWNLLGRIEHRLDEQPIDPSFDSRHEVWLASTRLNVRAARPLTLLGRLAGKWTSDEAFGTSLDGKGALASVRALYDLSKRFDLALSARARFDGGWDHRTDGLGAELGVVVTKNLRLSGGYNAFGFHDADFASMERTDKGPFVAFGFKFDEGLFGGSGAATPPAAEPAIDAQHGAIVTAPQDTLAARGDRLSDETIATDLRTIDGWRARVDALPDSAGLYGRAKARAWLELARDAYVSGDRNEEAAHALANAIALQRALAAGDTAAVIAAATRGLPGGGEDAELKAAAASVHDSPGFFCAKEEVARLEVETAWAAHEARGPGACAATPHLDNARRLAGEAKAKADDCIKAAAPPPPPPPSPVPAAPIAPNREIQQALSGIPAGIHFALNKSELGPTSRNVVARIAAVLVEFPEVRVELEGHTDSRGSAEYNLALSKRRAEAVQAGLVARGVDASRITTTFAGKENLLNAEKDVTDLALNRRVDFKYYDANGAPIVAEKQTGDIQVEKPAPRTRKKP